MRLAEVSLAEIRPDQVRRAQVGPGEVRLAEVGHRRFAPVRYPPLRGLPL